MITIFEGADGAGKTTVIEALRTLHATAVVNHGPYRNETSIAWRYLETLKAAHRDGGHVFMDRSWLSEPIYGRAYRHGEDRVKVAGRRMLDRVALSLGAVVVRCAPPFKACAEAFTRRKANNGEYLDNVEQLRAVYTGYSDDLRTDLQVIDFDYTTMKMNELWARIERVRPLQNLGPGIGRWAPGEVTLLVGDRMNSSSDWDLPFVSFNAGGCSGWLADGLENASVPESDLYWVNSTAQDGTPISAEFVAELRPTKVIALGANARTWCDGHGLDATKVPHPQFWKRFKSTEPYQLFSVLQEVL